MALSFNLPPRYTWIVLPAYNEEAALPRLFDRIRLVMEEARLGYRIILVDDGSTDRTGEIAESFKATHNVAVVRHDVNRGLGATIRDGLMEAAKKANPDDIIVTLDADNTHTPELILRMTRLVREGNDVVVASRYRPGSRVRGVPVVRRLVSRVGNLVVKTLFPIRGVRDYTCGYRAYRAEVLQRMVGDPAFFDQDGFQVMVDILLKLRTDKNLIFGEVPLILRYDLKAGASKMQLRKTMLDTMRLLIKSRVGVR